MDQSGALTQLDQSRASKHRQTTPPSWPCVQLNSDALSDNTCCEKKLDFSDYKLNNSTMDKDNIKDSVEMEKIYKNC